jgi:OmpA-OmpF porin, OOP family
MRSESLFLVMSSATLALIAAVGCATPQAKATCQPVSSWSAPVFRCATPLAPVVAAVPEAPAPVAPEPEPARPQTAEIQGEMIELSDTIKFDTDSANLLAESKSLLDQVAKTLNDHPEIKRVMIEGYTDAVASRGYNQKLSEERVASVKAYLVGQGIDEGRLRTRGFGERKPVGSNKTEDGRAKNRRVQFRILERQ